MTDLDSILKSRDITLPTKVQGGLNSVRLIDTEGADDHMQNIDPDQGRNDVENLPLGGSLQNQQTTCDDQ